MRTKAPALPRDGRLYARLGVILAFAVAGGLALGRAATPILIWLYRRFTNQTPSPEVYEQFGAPQSVLPIALIGALLAAFLGNLVLRSVDRTVERWDSMHTGDKVTLFLGFFAGIVAALPFLLLFQNLAIPQLYLVIGICGLMLAFASVSIYALQSMSDVLPWNRGRGPGRRSGIKILDTNVIIDGRIYDVARTGFLEGQIYVPGFVLEELQHIADSHDPLRRQRGRRGLDVLRHLQADFNVDVRSQDKVAPDLGDGVDARLVRLAKSLGADIVTNDFNLNRVASLQEVRVISLNDLALALRSNVMPQESLRLTVIREGNQQGQGVGYLEDGTMVVVENGKPHIGETLDVTVTQVIQTERGKMIFAEVGGEAPGDGHRRAPRRPRH